MDAEDHNDVAKHFASLPGMFSLALPGFGTLNVMRLATQGEFSSVETDLQCAAHSPR